MPTTDWNVLFTQLLLKLEALPPTQRSPEHLAEVIRDQIRPKCLALLVDTPGSSARQLVWSHGFDLPADRSIPRGEDPLSWLSRTAGASLFDRRTQAYVSAFKIGKHRSGWLCTVSSRRGQALVMERMYLAAVGVIFGRLSTGEAEMVSREPQAHLMTPFIPRHGADLRGGTASALLTVTEVDRKNLLKLAQAVESAAESIIICDLSGEIEYVNPAFEHTTGYRLNEVVGKTPRLLKSGVHPPSVYANMWKTVLSGRPWLGTFVNRRKDGKLYDEEITIAPIRDENDVITGFVSVGEDVSERLQRERERKALARASLATTGALGLPVALEVILHSAAQATTADGSGIVFVGRARAEFDRPVHVGALASDASLAPNWLESIEKIGVKQLEPVSILSDSQLEELSGLGSVAILPLRTKGEVLGVAFAASRQSGVFSSRHHSVLESLASQATVAIENTLLHQDLQRRIKMFESLGQLTRALRTAQNLDALLQLIVEEGSRFLRATGAAVLLLDPSGSFLSVQAAFGPFTVMRGSFPTHESLLGLPLNLGHLVIAKEDEIETFVRLTGIRDLRALMLTPLSTSAGQIGIAAIGRQQAVAFLQADLELVAILADVASTAIHRVRLREELEEAYVGATLALAEAVDARDSYVTGHAQRTGDLAERVALVLGLPEDQVQDIRYGAILHDVGKISVPDNILQKVGPLSMQEWDVVRRHTIAGARILAPVTKLARAAQVVRCHHERWDGSGYPDGLRGEQIPLGARIVAVVDAYTAMIDERTYRKALTHDEALQELQRHAGTQFDPAVVEAFLRVVSGNEFRH